MYPTLTASSYLQSDLESSISLVSKWVGRKWKPDNSDYEPNSGYLAHFITIPLFICHFTPSNLKPLWKGSITLPCTLDEWCKWISNGYISMEVGEILDEKGVYRLFHTRMEAVEATYLPPNFDGKLFECIKDDWACAIKEGGKEYLTLKTYISEGKYAVDLQTHDNHCGLYSTFDTIEERDKEIAYLWYVANHGGLSKALDLSKLRGYLG